jgi:hypothetical protein|tara:strand:+ start:2857 stop:3234 length:378 start_codon:yes stop_codon:yes gene_type:complete
MRATINFETNVDEIFSVMFSLIELEAERLHDAAYALDEASTTDVISLLDAAVKDAHLASVQLQQYRDMLVSFEQTKFNTMQPQTATAGRSVDTISQVREETQAMEMFDKFINKVNEGDPSDSEEG